MDLGCQPLFVSPITTPVKTAQNSKNKRSVGELLVTPSREPAAKKQIRRKHPKQSTITITIKT